MSKKDFKSIGAIAVSKFINKPQASNGSEQTASKKAIEDNSTLNATIATKLHESTQAAKADDASNMHYNESHNDNKSIKSISAPIADKSKKSTNPPKSIKHDHEVEKLNSKTTQAEEIKKSPKYKEMERFGLRLEVGLLEYLDAIAGIEGISVTEYINNLVKQDKEDKNEQYQMILKIKQLSQIK